MIDSRRIYRCDRCGALAYEPKGDCKCFMGPRWVAGIWLPSNDSADLNSEKQEGE